MKPFAVLLPLNLSFEESIKDKKGIQEDYLKYLIYIVLSKLAFYIENNEEDDVPVIDAQEKDVSIPKCYQGNYDKYKRHIDYLKNEELLYTYRASRTTVKTISTNVLNRDPYILDEKRFTYKLSFIFKGMSFNVAYITDTRLINKIKKNESVIPQIVDSTSGKYKFLKKYFDPKKLNIDLDRAVQLCQSRRKEHNSYSKYLNEVKQLIDLYNGIYRIYNKESDRRIHSNITRLPKVYRKYVTYNNKQLVEVDLSNSIIYFLASLISNKISKEVLQMYSLPLMFNKTLESLDGKEMQLILKLATTGEFYNDFIPLFEKEYTALEIGIFYEKENDDRYIGTFKQKRKVVKKRILAMLFAETKDYLVEQEMFKTEYPTLLENINRFKDKEGYKTFSHALLQIESHYMLDEVARVFNKENWRKAPVLTLHDCLITTVDYAEELENTMERVFTDLLDIPPKMKAEEWD